jgi:hypothetical protein
MTTSAVAGHAAAAVAAVPTVSRHRPADLRPRQRPGVITIDPLAMSGERLYAPPTGIVQSIY